MDRKEMDGVQEDVGTTFSQICEEYKKVDERREYGKYSMRIVHFKCKLQREIRDLEDRLSEKEDQLDILLFLSKIADEKYEHDKEKESEKIL